MFFKFRFFIKFYIISTLYQLYFNQLIKYIVRGFFLRLMTFTS